VSLPKSTKALLEVFIRTMLLYLTSARTSVWPEGHVKLAPLGLVGGAKLVRLERALRGGLRHRALAGAGRLAGARQTFTGRLRMGHGWGWGEPR